MSNKPGKNNKIDKHYEDKRIKTNKLLLNRHSK